MARGELKDPSPPPPPGQGWDVPDLVPVGGTRHCLPGGIIPREGDEPQRTPVLICAPPPAGQGSDPGGGEPPPTMLPQV